MVHLLFRLMKGPHLIVVSFAILDYLGSLTTDSYSLTFARSSIFSQWFRVFFCGLRTSRIQQDRQLSFSVFKAALSCFSNVTMTYLYFWFCFQ